MSELKPNTKRTKSDNMEKICTICKSKFEYKEEGISGFFGLLKVEFCDFCLACMGAMHESLNSLDGEDE
jgi:hypothetical protein